MKIRPLLIVLSLSGLPLAASAQEHCPQFPGPARVRLEQQARWLVSDSLQKQIAARSSAFGQLIAFERCHILQSNLLSDQVSEEEGPFFVADNVPLKSRVGRYQRTWMMVIAPTEATGKLPNANVLKITDHKWTLLNRDKDGSTQVLAKGILLGGWSPSKHPGWPSLSRSLRRLGLFSQSTVPIRNCHPDRSFSSRPGWEAQWRDLLFLSSHSNPGAGPPLRSL
jgi:hypothetical protein